MRRIAALVILSLLAACASVPPKGLPPVVNEPAVDPAKAGSYQVKAGDTIYSVARELRLSVRSLIDANQLQPPYQLLAGQRLALPGAGFYLVVKGDSLSLIARKTGVPFGTLARMNGLSAPYLLQVGQKLQLPVAANLPVARVAVAPVAVTAPPVEPLSPLSPAAPEAVSVVALPPPSAGRPPMTPNPAGAAPAGTSQAQAAPVAVPVPTAPAPIAPAPIASITPAAVPLPLPAPPAKSDRGFVWPVKGEVIAEFGTTGKGQQNDGINIAAPRGTPVIAADSGVVAYAGNELRGFGNLLLIKHEDGWMTAYAHNDQLLVKRGDVVRRGQKIASVGDSGGVSQPQLHFEIRRGPRAIDPAPILAGKKLPSPESLDPPAPG
jgi:murein DD-endopeptidase MepM/ murein hydrolase activator NlpD